MSPFVACGDFPARSRFARSTIPEEKGGTTRGLFIYSFIYLFIHSFIHSIIFCAWTSPLFVFIYLFIYLFISLFIQYCLPRELKGVFTLASVYLSKLAPARVSYRDDFLISYRVYIMTGSVHTSLFEGTLHVDKIHL